MNKPFYKKLSQKQLDTMAMLHKEGMSYLAISREFNVSKNAVYYHLSKNAKESYSRYAKKFALRHPEYHDRKNILYGFKRKMKVIRLLGGRCIRCGTDDFRVLQIHHVNGRGREEFHQYKAPHYFYRAVLTGDRPVEDLELRCANCNLVAEYEGGKRKILLLLRKESDSIKTV